MLVVEQAILSTDLALYFRKKDIFLETANAGEIDWQEQDKKDCEWEYSINRHIMWQFVQEENDFICGLILLAITANC